MTANSFKSQNACTATYQTKQYEKVKTYFQLVALISSQRPYSE